MSYRVLARRWRPQNFAGLVGQEHVVRALRNALEQNRLHHACLFTGTRGVGKTTLARILSKCLNCARGVSADPCGECEACRGIDEGRFMDLLEVDAASRARVDETRDLMDSVPYAPTQGRYKVYLIDEVHMFSNHSFNALLKVLEEPPDHVKFLLATTEPKRIPVTVLSRCLQFNLRRLMPGQIAAQLEHILKSESIPFDTEATRFLAEAAEGSMRDALSLLDQAISDGGGELHADPVKAMLGTVEQADVEGMLEAVISGDGAALLAECARVADLQTSPSEVLSALMHLLQRIAFSQAADTPAATARSVADFSARIPPEHVQLYYQIALTGRRDLPMCPNPQGGLEMCLVRMLAFRPGTEEPRRMPEAAARPKASVDTPPAGPRTHSSAPATPGAEAAACPEEDTLAVWWHNLIEKLELPPLARQLALHCTPHTKTEDALWLRPDTSLETFSKALLNEKNRQRLRQALEQALGTPLKLEVQERPPGSPTPAEIEARQAQCQQEETQRCIEEDPNVQRLQSQYGASISAVRSLES